MWLLIHILVRLLDELNILELILTSNPTSYSVKPILSFDSSNHLVISVSSSTFSSSTFWRLKLIGLAIILFDFPGIAFVSSKGSLGELSAHNWWFCLARRRIIHIFSLQLNLCWFNSAYYLAVLRRNANHRNYHRLQAQETHVTYTLYRNHTRSVVRRIKSFHSFKMQ